MAGSTVWDLMAGVMLMGVGFVVPGVVGAAVRVDVEPVGSSDHPRKAKWFGARPAAIQGLSFHVQQVLLRWGKCF